MKTSPNSSFCSRVRDSSCVSVAVHAYRIPLLTWACVRLHGSRGTLSAGRRQVQVTALTFSSNSNLSFRPNSFVAWLVRNAVAECGTEPPCFPENADCDFTSECCDDFECTEGGQYGRNLLSDGIPGSGWGWLTRQLRTELLCRLA